MRAAEASAKELGEALTIVNEVAYEAVSDADRELAYAEKWRDYSKSRGRGIKHRRCCEGTAVLLRSAKLRCAKFRHANYPAGQAEFARLDKQMRVIEERFVWLKKARTEVQANKDLDLGCDQADAAGQGVAVNLSCRQEEPKVLFQNSRALVIGQGSIGRGMPAS